jgi:hypothetical protein
MIGSAISAIPPARPGNIQEPNLEVAMIMKVHQCAAAGIDRLEQISAFQDFRTILNKDA